MHAKRVTESTCNRRQSITISRIFCRHSVLKYCSLKGMQPSYICVDGAVRMILGAVPSARPPMCRLYIEQYSADTSTHKQDAQEALSKIIKVALDVSQLTKFTSREKPTVIT